MVAFTTLYIMYREMKKSYCSPAYLRTATELTIDAVNKQLRLMKTIGLLDVTLDDNSTRKRVYRIKEKYAYNFELFLKAYAERCGE